MPIRYSRRGTVMAVALKRTEVGEQEEVDREAERIQVWATGLQSARDEFLDALSKFARGWTKWETEGWGWEDPEPGSDPKTWPPLARILWHFLRGSILEGRLAMDYHSEVANWCCDCHLGEEMPKGYGWKQELCLEHMKWRQLVCGLATHLGWRERDSDVC